MTEQIIKEFEGRITAVEESSKSAHKRMDSIDKLTESVYTLANETKLMREDMNKVESRLCKIEAKPAQKWELVGTIIITSIVSGVVGMLISGLVYG